MGNIIKKLFTCKKYVLISLQHLTITYFSLCVPAIKLDNCNVTHYTAWTLMDNFEWASGFSEKFGLYFVNFTDPDLTRVAKDSAVYYQQVILDNGFPDPNPPVIVKPAPVPEVEQSRDRSESNLNSGASMVTLGGSVALLCMALFLENIF